MDFKTLLVGLLTVAGISAALILILWVSAAIGSWWNAPWISGIDPIALQWYHWFDADGTPYSYALYALNAGLWWNVTLIVCPLVVFIVIFFILAISS